MGGFWVQSSYSMKRLFHSQTLQSKDNATLSKCTHPASAPGNKECTSTRNSILPLDAGNSVILPASACNNVNVCAGSDDANVISDRCASSTDAPAHGTKYM